MWNDWPLDRYADVNKTIRDNVARDFAADAEIKDQSV